MPLSYLRRPLCLILASYIALLCLLRAWGAFRIDAPAEWDPWLWKPSLRLEGEVVSGFAAKRQGERIRLRIERVEGAAPPSRERAFVYLPPDWPEDESIRPGQRISLEGRLRRPRWPRIPGDFDEQGFCSDRGVAFLFQARRLRVLDAGMPWILLPMAWAETAHRSIHRMLKEALAPEEASIWEGLLLGYLGPIPPRLRAVFQDAGVMHLLVPSGAKVAFVLAMIAWLIPRLGGGPLFKTLACAVAGGFYVLVVGAEPPYMRAYFCAVLAWAFRGLERDPTGFQAVLWSAFGILAFDPRQLFCAGFQMTYAAILGVMIALPRWKVPGRWSPPARTAVRLALLGFVVQLMLLPMLARMFGRVSAIAVAANAVLVPLSGAYMAAGFAAWLAYLSPFAAVARPSFQALSLLARLFEGLCARFAAVPGAAWDAGAMGWRGEAAYYLAALGLLSLPQWRLSLRAWAAAGLAGAAVWWTKPAGTRVLFAERGGRGLILVRSREGADRLVASDLSPAELRRTLAAAGVRAFGPGPSRLELGRVRIDFGPGKSVVSDGGSQFCILHPSFARFERLPSPGMGECAPGRGVSTRRDGAVWVKIDEIGYSVETQRELYSIGRSLL